MTVSVRDWRSAMALAGRARSSLRESRMGWRDEPSGEEMVSGEEKTQSAAALEGVMTTGWLLAPMAWTLTEWRRA